MLKHPVNKQYTSYAWLLDEEGNPKTGGAASIACKVIDESEGLFASPVVTEVDSVNAPGLYKANVTPDQIGFWKVFWDSAVAGADISGGEVIYVCDSEVDETDVISYPDADATEIDITEMFTVPWSTYYARRRTHKGTLFDLSSILSDGSAPAVTVRRYVKVDGVNWSRIDETVIPNATMDPCVRVQSETLNVDYKITMQLSAGLTLAQDLPYHYIVEFEDLCT
jgi:hypothetical protein